MKLNIALCFSMLMILTLAITLVSGCDDDDDDDDNGVAGDDDGAGDDDSHPDCTLEELCQFNVDCELGFTSVDECLTETETQLEECAEAEGFFDCVCDCFYEHQECDAFNTCGGGCFDAFCS